MDPPSPELIDHPGQFPAAGHAGPPARLHATGHAVPRPGSPPPGECRDNRLTLILAGHVGGGCSEDDCCPTGGRDGASAAMLAPPWARSSGASGGATFVSSTAYPPRSSPVTLARSDRMPTHGVPTRTWRSGGRLSGRQATRPATLQAVSTARTAPARFAVNASARVARGANVSAGLTASNRIEKA